MARIRTGTICFFLGLAAGGAARADGVVCDGVLGNSGQAGETLVRFAPTAARGMGVACDRFGSLWDRAGRGRLNRYAPDGRLLASHPLPDGANNGDKLTLVGETLAMLISGRLYRLPVTAAAGTKPEATGASAECISFGSHRGRIAAATKEGRLLLLDPSTGAAEAALAAPLENVRDLELTPDGTIHAVVDPGRIVQARGGTLLDGAPARRTPGERAQFLGGAWFGHAWHGTVRRFDADGRGDPGVVLGGASGSFIGYLPQNSELTNGRGLAKLGEGLYAVSGLGGVMHLLRWQPEARRMRIVRRIGALAECRGMGLDGQGRIWAATGSWEWSDGPDAPMRFGVNSPESPGIGQAVMLPSGAMVAPGRLWGRDSLYGGTFEAEVRIDPLRDGARLPKGFVASAAYRLEGGLVLLVVDAAGAGQIYRIGPDGRFGGAQGDARLQTSRPVERLTALAMKDTDTLLAAGDGWVIELARDGRNWKETRRWQTWGSGPAERFGGEIHLAADAGRLWIADTRRHRVLCFDLASGRPLGAFGRIDEPGAALTALSSPTSLAANSRRAVVYDAANQRLLKLRLAGGGQP